MAKDLAGEDTLKQFYVNVEKENLGALWKNLGHMITRRPSPGMKPYLWKWETIRKYVLQSEFLPLGKDSERRVIYLQNPSLMNQGLIGYGTNTLYAGIQLLLPGEVAPAHRHSQTAIRFIIEGEGAFTAINGERTYMEEGDLILTPSYTWHDHGHEGSKPMIWMDGLDVGLVRNFAASFFEGFSEEAFPTTGVSNGSVLRYASGSFRPVTKKNHQGYPSPLLAYKWTKAKEALDALVQANEACPFDGYAIEYLNPSNAGPADRRVGTSMQLLKKGVHTKAHRHVHSAIYHVKEGTGYTVIDGKRFDWSKGDFFALPPWAVHEHVNTGEGDAYLFSINDRPVLEVLDLEREEALEEGNGYQEITGVFNPGEE